MKMLRGVWTALALVPVALISERSAKAEVLVPATTEEWVLEDLCHREGLQPDFGRCFAKRWMPANVAHERRIRAMVHPNANCDGQKQSAYSPTLTPAAMGANDLITAYNLPADAPTGAGEIVAVVDACGYSDLVTELNAYRTQYGIPTITQCGGKNGVAPTKGGTQCVGIVSQTGTATVPADDSNWAGETALDVQMVSAACPKCSILVVQVKSASTANLEAGIAEAVKLGAAGVSNSWGSSESGSDTQLPAYKGTIIAAASGDADYLNQIGAIDEDAGTVDYSPQSPNWPASDPNVLGVGGTTLTMDPTSSRCYSDTAWSYMVPTTSTSALAGKTVYGGGSGCSTDYPTPSYQSSINMGSCTKRGSVDVSAAADFSPGVYKNQICVKGQPCGGIAVYGGGGWNPSVGTSAATPFMTAVLVRMGLGAKANADFYSNHGGFTDVTSGNNDPSGTCSDVMCNAGAGWDGPTGWGVPNGYELALQGGATGVTQPPTPVCAQVTDAGAAPVDAGDDATTGGGGGDDAGSGGSGDDSGSGGGGGGGGGD
ncbi:MAG TPA: S53 family peptidase, partial [Polyangiaceae bacterium]